MILSTFVEGSMFPITHTLPPEQAAVCPVCAGEMHFVACVNGCCMNSARCERHHVFSVEDGGTLTVLVQMSPDIAELTGW